MNDALKQNEEEEVASTQQTNEQDHRKKCSLAFKREPNIHNVYIIIFKFILFLRYLLFQNNVGASTI